MLEAIERTSARLTEAGVCFGHGTTNAFDEAAWLVLWRLGLPLDDLDGVADRVAGRRRSRRRSRLSCTSASPRASPAAYLTGEAWLQGVPFHVDERAIVPRSLIAELLADGTLDAWLPADPRACSTCAPATAVSRCWRRWPGPKPRWTPATCPRDALAVARSNVDRHGLAGRIALRQGDGLAAAARAATT